MKGDYDGRKLVHEIVERKIMIEIYEKDTDDPKKKYYDYQTKHLYYVGDEEKRGIFCQQRDLRDHGIAILRTMEWISNRHKELKGN